MKIHGKLALMIAILAVLLLARLVSFVIFFLGEFQDVHFVITAVHSVVLGFTESVP